MEGVIPPRGWRPRGFLTQKIMKDNNNNSRILNKFDCSVLKGMKSLDSDISQLIDKHFWSLSEDTSENTDNLWLRLR